MYFCTTESSDSEVKNVSIFLLISSDNEDNSKPDPFVVKKGPYQLFKSCKKIVNLLKMTNFVNCPVTVIAHASLNSSNGVISHKQWDSLELYKKWGGI